MSQMLKIAKFGGSSLATAASIQKAADLIKADPAYCAVVVSAPGARGRGDPKVTDLLIQLHTAYQTNDKNGVGETIEALYNRFSDIICGLLPAITITQEELAETLLKAAEDDSLAYIKSRGEYLSAKILAAVLGEEWCFLDAADFIRFDEDGSFNLAATKEAWGGLEFAVNAKLVIPGFYGVTPSGCYETFPRGGSDITGAIVALLTEAEVYDNWTDVPGVYSADPHVVEDTQLILRLTRAEMCELAYGGASVLHPDALAPLMGTNTRVHIRSTFRPTLAGTWIYPDPHITHTRDDFFVGIAGRTGAAMLTVQKPSMNDERGFLLRLFEVLVTRRINVEQVATGVDTVSVVVAAEDLGPELSTLKTELEQKLGGKVSIQEEATIISVVTRNASNIPRITALVFKTLTKAEIPVYFHTQGTAISLILVVPTSYYREALQKLHRALIKANAMIS